jgi:hypothetical protein
MPPKVAPEPVKKKKTVKKTKEQLAEEQFASYLDEAFFVSRLTRADHRVALGKKIHAAFSIYQADRPGFCEARELPSIVAAVGLNTTSSQLQILHRLVCDDYELEPSANKKLADAAAALARQAAAAAAAAEATENGEDPDAASAAALVAFDAAAAAANPAAAATTLTATVATTTTAAGASSKAASSSKKAPKKSKAATERAVLTACAAASAVTLQQLKDMEPVGGYVSLAKLTPVLTEALQLREVKYFLTETSPANRGGIVAAHRVLPPTLYNEGLVVSSTVPPLLQLHAFLDAVYGTAAADASVSPGTSPAAAPSLPPTPPVACDGLPRAPNPTSVEVQRLLMGRETEETMLRAFDTIWDAHGRRIDMDRRRVIDGEKIREALITDGRLATERLTEAEATEFSNAYADLETGMVKEDTYAMLATE